MRRVATRQIQLENYASIVPESLLAETLSLAERLRGLHVALGNATPVESGYPSHDQIELYLAHNERATQALARRTGQERRR